MSYPLRLPPNLEAAARERAAGIGISFNAFICVCVDAYINGAKPAIQADAPRAATQSERRRAKRDEAEFLAVERAAFGPDDEDENGQSIAEGERDEQEYRERWREFHPDPEMWPWHDPEPAWDKRRNEIFAKYGDAHETASKALEREYWATRERPAYEVSEPAPQRSKRRGKSVRPG